MSWPVFIKVNDASYPLSAVLEWRGMNHDTRTGIRVQIAGQEAWLSTTKSPTEFEQHIAEAIASTAKAVARAEAEAIDEHRAEVSKRAEFWTKPEAA